MRPPADWGGVAFPTDLGGRSYPVVRTKRSKEKQLLLQL